VLIWSGRTTVSNDGNQRETVRKQQENAKIEEHRTKVEVVQQNANEDV